MVAEVSPEWLPPGFTVKTKYRSGKKVKYYFNIATGKKYYSKNEVIRCAAECNSMLVTPQTKNADDDNGPSSFDKVDAISECNSMLVTPQTKNADDVNGPSSFDKVDAISEKTNDLEWLPSGWTVEERTRKSGSAYGSSYKVYTESSTEKKFYSKASIIRYLNDVAHIDIMTTQNKSDNVDEPLPDKSLQISPVTNTGSVSGKKRKANSLVKVSAVMTSNTS